VSAIKVLRSVIVGVGLSFALYFLTSKFLGPGLFDSSTPIIGGYEYDDVGAYEKLIVYRGDSRTSKIVVDARVDDYKVAGNRIFVARRPRVSTLAKDGALDSRLLPTCEYWAINVETHSVEQTDDSAGLACN
jgi:hypothetical protein